MYCNQIIILVILRGNLVREKEADNHFMNKIIIVIIQEFIQFHLKI